MIAIITGSGVYELSGLSVIERIDATSPFGPPSDRIVKCDLEGRTVMFLPRHGSSHTIPPHRVNYRANIWALKELGVERIISVSAVGGINRDFAPGSIVLADQILDFTKSRISTFYDGDDVVHVDFTTPFCEDMRNIISGAAEAEGIELITRGTYVAVEGPRLETAAEIGFYRSAGADVVGMTAMPEAVLAREAELCYAGIYVVTNYAAGIRDGRLTTDEVVVTMRRADETIKRLLAAGIEPLDGERRCACGNALDNARL